MVSVMHLQPAAGARWFNYLALSLLLNALIISIVTMPRISMPVATPERIAIKLTSRAAPPPPAPMLAPLPSATRQPAPARKNIITETGAAKKIAAPVPRLQPEQVTPPVVKEVPVPEIVPPVLAGQAVMENTQVQKPAEPLLPTRQSMLESTPELLAEGVHETRTGQETTHADNGRDSATTVVHEARYRKQVPPVYPRRALELGQQGTVTLHARVKADGLPEELKIVETSGHSLLDKAALAAVEKWEFEPVIQNGIATSGWVRVPIEFVIQ